MVITRLDKYKARTFALTFLAYMCFHLTRKVPSVIKGVLHPQSSTGKSSYDPVTNPGWAPFNQDLVPEKVSKNGYVVSGAKSPMDGTYNCINDEMPCKVYAKNNGNEKLMLGNETLCPFEHLSECWVMTTQNGDEAVVMYAQPAGDVLPASSPSSDAPDCIHWEEKIGPNEYKSDKSVKAKPNMVDGAVLLGTVDSVFLGAYTLGLFFSGYLGDKMDLRLFLTIGMVGTSASMFFMALEYTWKIHSMTYTIIMSIFFGLFQSIGWPSVVAIMGRWFGHGSRGLVMGIWNSHTSVGNILGSIITAASVGTGLHHEDWPLGYAIPAFIMLVSAVIVYTALVVDPKDAGFNLIDGVDAGTGTEEISDSEAQQHQDQQQQHSSSMEEFDDLSYEYRQAHELDTSAEDLGRALLTPSERDIHQSEEQVEQEELAKTEAGLIETFKQAIMIPGLIPFSLSLLFSKMCAYSLLFWGPYYLSSLGFKSETAGYLCTFFDVGGVFGGIAAGYLSDRLNARGIVAFVFQIVCVPVLGFYYNATNAAGTNVTSNIWLMILAGFFVNAPYALITTAVSADLGSQIEGNDRLLATVTGIIDGTGSFGAMIQGIVVGLISSDSWESVWHFLMIAQAFSALMLVRLVWREGKLLWWQSR